MPPCSSSSSLPPPPPPPVESAASSDLFLQLCVLAGCDFLPSLPSVGLKTAARHLSRLRCAHRFVRSMRLAGKSVPAGYEEGLCRALWTFKHQTVFCPHARECVPLTPLPEVSAEVAAGAGGDGVGVGSGPAGRGRLLVPPAAAVGVPTLRDLDFLGPLVPAEVAAAVASCSVDPMTRRPFTREELMPPTARAGVGAGAGASAAGAARGGGGWQQQRHHQSHHHHHQMLLSCWTAVPPPGDATAMASIPQET